MSDFRSKMESAAVRHKDDVLGVRMCGKWQGKEYRHILPRQLWDLNLWEPIRASARIHFLEQGISWHEQRHNLLSSQIQCVNVFYPLRDQQALLAAVLVDRLPQLARVGSIHFECTGDQDYLNEHGGRGRMRTSADLAVEWFDGQNSRNLLLLEYKFTETGFGDCGGAKSTGNKDKSRCRRAREIVEAPGRMCYLVQPKARPYWEIALASDGPLRAELLARESYCPFRYDFYQLMRNQFLAHQIQSDPDSGFDSATFGVIYHDANENLLRMGHPFGGQRNPLKAWSGLLREPKRFMWFTVQELLAGVDAKLPSHLAEWRAFLRARYEL
jgi:hypothetical protein